jgi:hypothetical protein
MNECGGRKDVVAGGKVRTEKKGKTRNKLRGLLAFQILSHSKIAKLHQARCSSRRNTTSTNTIRTSTK